MHLYTSISNNNQVKSNKRRLRQQFSHTERSVSALWMPSFLFHLIVLFCCCSFLYSFLLLLLFLFYMWPFIIANCGVIKDVNLFLRGHFGVHLRSDRRDRNVAICITIDNQRITLFALDELWFGCSLDGGCCPYGGGQNGWRSIESIRHSSSS